MLNTRSILLCAILAGSPLLCLRAQDFRPGYIIQSNNDSIVGYVAYHAQKKNLHECTFKLSKKSSPSTYGVQDLKRFGFTGDKKFEMIDLAPNPFLSGKLFAEVIVKGTLNLYRVENFYVAGKDSLMILPVPKGKDIYNTNGRWFKEDKRYVGLLNSLLIDCQLSANETSYSEAALTYLVMNYNRCKGSTIQFKKPSAVAKFNFQMFTGISRSKSSMDLHEDISFAPSYTVIGGAAVDISSPRFFDRVFLSFEAWYIKSLSQAYAEGPYIGDMRYRDITMEVSYIKLPIGFRYNFKHESNTPFVRAGFSFSAIGKITMRTVEEIEAGGVIYSNEYYDGYVFRSPRSIWFSVGYDKTLVRKLRVFAELRYERGSGFVGTKIQSFSTLSSLNMLTGIRF